MYTTAAITQATMNSMARGVTRQRGNGAVGGTDRDGVWRTVHSSPVSFDCETSETPQSSLSEFTLVNAFGLIRYFL